MRGKSFLAVLAIGALALVLGWVIMSFVVDGVLQAPFAEGFVALCEAVLHLPYRQGMLLYQILFRGNKYFWESVGFLALLLGVFYLVLRYYLAHFARNLNEVSAGIDKLVQESAGEIVLSPELDAIAKKLNAARAMLEKRVREA